MYDAAIVGARAAGAATAMLLARAGLSVVVVDRARFPSDTLSTHQVQTPGIARLRRWGLLDAVAATTPAVQRVRLDTGSHGVTAPYPAHDGARALYGPRRTLLDALLVDAARAAGAEVVEGFAVTGLTSADGRVTGFRGRTRGRRAADATGGDGGGRETEVGARLVIGADGKRSAVAAAVGAASYRVRPARTFAAYSYWADLPLPTGGEIHVRPGLTAPVFATNDGLTMAAVFAPLDQFEAFRRDPEAGYARLLDRCGDLGERARAATRVERLRTAPDEPNRFRVPHGPGWALVGDAGIVQDPVGAQGISNAFRDAELLADAVVSGRDLATYHRARDAAATPMDDVVGDLARLRVGVRLELLLRVLDAWPAAAEEFLGVLAGSYAPRPLLDAARVRRVLDPAPLRRALPRSGLAGQWHA